MRSLMSAYFIPASFAIVAFSAGGDSNAKTECEDYGWMIPSMVAVMLLFPTAGIAYWAGITRDK